MIHLVTFNNEMEAQLLGSRLKGAGIDHRIDTEDGRDECSVMVFEDDLDEATEILEAASLEDKDFIDDELGGIDDLDDLADLED
jgi:hypothetical protein